jgi:oxaloacetate decarboxylase alpha subunit
MPRLVDTTIRLLGQEPLAGVMPTAELLRLAEILDGAGFAALEVSGGGVFDAALHRALESPWERIRALRARTKTPLALTLRGRFLVASDPVAQDVTRRFVTCAAENGIDVFRLHDPLNDVANLRDAAEGILAAGKGFDAGLVYSSGPTGETDVLVDRARRVAELGATRVILHDPTGSLQPHRAGELVVRLGEASGLPVGLHCHSASGTALASALEAVRTGADSIACAVYPVAFSLYRVPAESLAVALSGLGIDCGVDLDALWRASDLIDEHLGDEPVTPLAPRIAVRAAQRSLPASLVAALDEQLRALSADDRIDEVIDELDRIRAETGWPSLGSPIGQIIASQALLNVLSASRYAAVVDELRGLVSGRHGTPPADVDPVVRRAVSLLSDPDTEDHAAPSLDDVPESAEGLASSEEELLLLVLFREEAEPLLRRIRGRGTHDEAAAVDDRRSERIRELVQIVQDSGVGEVTIEEDGMRVTVRRTEESEEIAGIPLAEAPLAVDEPPPALPPIRANELVRVTAPMVGIFYRSSQPGSPAFVEEGDLVGAGQTLCILEAMKLMNEVKAEIEGFVRAVHAQNAQPVEFGQLLFELEPVNGRPLDAF